MIAMTVLVIVVEDRIPVPTVLLFAGIVLFPAALVDAMVLFGNTQQAPDDPLSMPRPRRRSRRTDDPEKLPPEQG